MAERDDDIKPAVPSDTPSAMPGEAQPPVFAVPPTSSIPQFTADPSGQQPASQQFSQPAAPQPGMVAYAYDPRQGWVLVNQPQQPMQPVPPAFMQPAVQPQPGQTIQPGQVAQPLSPDRQDQSAPFMQPAMIQSAMPQSAAQPYGQPAIGRQAPRPAAQPQQSGTGAEVMLLGTYSPKIDMKGRMALPAKFRSQLGPGVVMARGQERCVYLFPQEEFRRVAMQIQRTSLGNKAAREYLRVFLSGAVDQTPDKQGRVLVPQMLRDYAKLGDDIVVIGVGTRAEIWNRQAWDQYLADNEQGYSDIANDVLPTMEW